MTVHSVYIALGSNLDSPVNQLQNACERITRISVGPLMASSIWLTEPVGFEKAVPDFANAVIKVATDKSPMELLQYLQGIEDEMGRVREVQGVSGGAHQSRLVDLDIVDYEGRQVNEPALILPHPRAAERLFVLMPLQEIDPTFRFPDREEAIEDLIAKAPAMQIQKSIPLIPSV